MSGNSLKFFDVFETLRIKKMGDLNRNFQKIRATLGTFGEFNLINV